MSYNSLTNTDANRVARWASLSSQNVNDSWGSNNGTWDGTPAYDTGPTGWLANAFDTTSADIEASSSVSGTAARTACMWVYRDGAQASAAALFSFDLGSSGASGSRWSVRVDSTSSHGLRVEIQGSGYTSSLVVPDAEWAFIGVAFSGTQLQHNTLYVNGSTESATGTSTLNTSSAITNIGRGAGTTLANFAGLIADVRHYSRALSTAELDEIRLGPEPVNTVAPTLNAGTGSYGVGTWDTDGNGSLTYTVTLHDASDDSTVATLQTDSASTSGNCLSELQSAGPGNYYVSVAATNDGGNEPNEDTVSATVAYPANTFSGVRRYQTRPRHLYRPRWLEATR